jgi:hypothetical protein
MHLLRAAKACWNHRSLLITFQRMTKDGASIFAFCHHLQIAADSIESARSERAQESGRPDHDRYVRRILVEVRRSMSNGKSSKSAAIRANPVGFLAGMNPDFFKGTAVEKEVARLIAGN